VAVLQTEATRSALGRNDFAEVEQTSQSLAIKAVALIVRDDATDIERAIAGFAQEPNGGLITPPDNGTLRQQAPIIALAAKHRLPAVYWARPFVDAGGLMFYAAAAIDYRRVAAYLDRIMGAKPGDLPVVTPDKFNLVINLKTATALGLTIPPSLFALADEVIE
jgi:putative ABC transport system substrate-binding protein